MDFLERYLPVYVDGLWVTLQLVFLALAIGLALAIPLAVARANGPLAVRAPIWAFVYFFRGTPLLVQLFLIYFGSGQFVDGLKAAGLWDIDLGSFQPIPGANGVDYAKLGFSQPWFCALIAFTLNTCAYTIEILRGAILATPHGEVEAARACGMSPGQIQRRVVLPSAFRRALPAYGNEVIFMLHGSAVASLVTLVDLTGAARIANSRSFAPFESFVLVGLFYMAITFALVGLFRWLERRAFAHLRPAGSGTAAGKPALARSG